MANRVKEDEKNERIIRNLLKLPENRRCINCNSLGPQYVCTNFSTFICTTCSGIHREFTHRVKSVSMAKFTLQEVSALQGGGNASAREIYLKEWDAQRNALPDGSNVERLRDFIKHVYVDRRYTGERNLDKPLREKMGEPEVSSGKRTDTYQSGSRSPPYEDTFDRRYGDMRSPGGRSPGYDQDNRRNNDYRSPVRAELVNDWRREDRFGNGRKSEDRNSDGGSKLEARSPDSQRDSDMSSPPMVRPVRDILGDNVSPLRVIEPPKPIAGKSIDGSVHTQRTASSSSLASSDGKPPEVKVEASLIDFDSVPEPPITAATEASVVQLTSTNNNNWANFDPMPAVKVHTAVSGSVESILSELSISAPVSAPSSGGSKDPSLESFFGSAAPPSVLPSAGSSATSLGPPPHLANAEGSLFPNITMGGQWSNLKPENHPVFPGVVGQPVPQLTTAATDGSLSNKEVINLDFQQPWNAPVGSNVHEPSGAYVPQGTADAKPTMGASFASGIESTSDPKSVGRKELPEDLFTANYPWAPFPVSGWYSSSPYVAQVPMQYKMPMSAPALPNFQAVSRSTNPFDFGGGPSSVQASTFPSVAPLQGALPKVATPSGPLHHAASLGAPQSHPTSIFTRAPSYPSAIPPSSYVGQEVVGSMTSRSEGLSGFSIEEPSAFVSLNPNYQLGGLHPAPSGSSNPFG